MAVIASKVVGGDLIDSCSVVGNPAYTLNNEEIGIRFAIKGSSIFGFLGRFELEIPADLILRHTRQDYLCLGRAGCQATRRR